MASVFVVNFAGHDHRKAEKWGDLRVMTTGYVSLGSLDRVLFEVTSALKASKKEDWLLPSGLLILNVIASAVWLRKHGELKILVWDRKEDDYREMRTDSGHLDYLLQHIGGGDELQAESHQGT